MQRRENSNRNDGENPRALADTVQAGVTVIVFEDLERQGRLISGVRACLHQDKTPLEFIVVSSRGPRLTPLSGSQQAETVRGLDTAIRLAKFDHVAIIDAALEFDISMWNIVNPIDKEEAFRSWSYAVTIAPGSRKVLVWLYCLIMRWLLGVSKNRIAPGITTFKKSLTAGLNLSRLDSKSADSASQLLAVAKLHGRTVEEHCCNVPQAGLEWTKRNSVDPHLPKSKSITHSIRRNLRFWFSELSFPARPPRTSHSISPIRHVLAALFILAAAASLLFTNSSYPLFEPDEARNAQLAINIVETGNWLTLDLFGEPYWDKPPMLAWLTAISYKCFGISEWSTRLPSALASLCLLAFMMFTGSKLVGYRATAIGTVALLLAWGFSFQSRYVTMDALLTCFTTIVILGVALAVTEAGSRRLQRRWLLCSGIAMGMGILTKGPICIVLTVPPIVAWMFLNREISRTAIKEAAKLVAIPAMVIALPWFAFMTIRNPEFAYYFIWKHHIVRFSDAFNHQEPFWYYGPMLWLFMFPASILLPRVMYVMGSSKPKYRRLRMPIHGLLVMFSFWVVLFFSLSECKLPAYILPAVPAIALLTGVVLSSELDRNRNKRTHFDRLPKRIAIGLFASSMLVIAVGAWYFSNPATPGILLPAIGILAIFVLLIRYPLRRSTSRRTSWLATAAIGMIFVGLGINHLIPQIAQHRSILDSISREGRKSIPVIYFGRDSFAAEIYLPDHEVIQIDDDSIFELKDAILRHPQATIVASDENISKLKQSFGNDIVVQEAPARHTFHASLSPARVANRQPANSTQR